MTSYQVTIHIANNWVQEFDENGYQLIMAKAVAGGPTGTIYNVVASTGIVTGTMIVGWTDNYQMTGSTQTFQNGGTVNSVHPRDGRRPDAKTVEITGLSALEPIKFGQTYYLKSWSEYNVATDPSDPPNGFGFKNTPPASVVLTLDVGGEYTPGMLNLTMHSPTHQVGTDVQAVYISPLELPPGKATIIPLPKVAFWFEANLSTSTMVVVDQSTIFEVDMSDAKPKDISYDENGAWHNNSGKHIHYVRPKPEH
ncbi:hypothetical protein GP486_002213 [Trichoglossum hirsutum]|uniref:Uncharacterized protein n=1 Tax=Trichoglossum hirsutum TaxID=265104 RepID=A0A9P8RRY5_9PEZI|nr:hypothetical protein GP486_002213 [Trichoglossum hirsutum]